MATISIHPEAEADLLEIARSEPDAAADLFALVEELGVDADLLDRLTHHGFGRRGVDPFDVSRWQGLWNAPHNFDIWRLKSFESRIHRYRMIYAVSPATMEHTVLAFVHRDDFDYERDHPITKRVIRAYEQLLDD